MKKAYIFGAILIILGLIVAIAPWTFAPVCEVHTAENPNGLWIVTSSGKLMPMPCGYTARAEIGVGALLVILGGLAALFLTAGNKLVMGIMGISVGGLVIALPTVLTGMCAMSSHPCRTTTEPVLILLGVVVIIVSLVVILYKPKVK